MGVDQGWCTGTVGVWVVGGGLLVSLLDLDCAVWGVDFAIAGKKNRTRVQEKLVMEVTLSIFRGEILPSQLQYMEGYVFG